MIVWKSKKIKKKFSFKLRSNISYLDFVWFHIEIVPIDDAWWEKSVDFEEEFRITSFRIDRVDLSNRSVHIEEKLSSGQIEDLDHIHHIDHVETDQIIIVDNGGTGQHGVTFRNQINPVVLVRKQTV